MSASSGSDSRATSRPSNTYWPLVGRSRQPMMFIIVDLPEPDDPMMATNSPRSTETLTACSARTSVSPSWKVRVRSMRRTTGSVMPMVFLQFQRRRGRPLRCTRRSLGCDDLISELEISRLDLGEGVVNQSHRNRDRDQLAGPLHPDHLLSGLGGFGEPKLGRSGRRKSQRLRWD